MPRGLTIRAGSHALARLRDGGFDPDWFSTLLGASGGPKWLVLSRMDRVLVEQFLGPRKQPLSVAGSSIGTFRHLCFAVDDPIEALDRFEAAYVGQAYESEPTPMEVTEESRRILNDLFGDDGRARVVSNDRITTHIIAVRSRVPVATDARLPLALGLGASAIANAIDRRLLGGFFERAVFHSSQSTIRFRGFGTRTIPLTEANIEGAALASGSIPLVMAGIRDVPGAPPGWYRDGGIVDYHFDFDFDTPDGLILYPHFFDGITPGWFDKALKWRTPQGKALEKTVLIAPSREFVRRLPGSKVPDRDDFRALPTKERLERWNQVVAECGVLADELADLLATGRLGSVAEPFE